MPLSLAPLRYQGVYAERGGPIASVGASQGRLYGGQACHNASARLRADLRPEGLVPLGVYSDEEGSGTDVSRTVACYKAVSEALERWAYYENVWGPRREALGFALDPTTNGMAAFPGWTARGARETAFAEAVERWSVLEWWRGSLPARPRATSISGLKALEVLTPFPKNAVAVIWTVGEECAGAAYGFAGGARFEKAAEKALVELTRNQRVLARFAEKGGEAGALESLLERRLLHFASEEGHRAFLERAGSSERLASAAPAPRTLVDAEVEGPWTRYARVWKVLFEHPGGPDRDEGVGVFQF